MVGRVGPRVGDIELQRRVLLRIWDRGEVKESDLYDLVGTPKRISHVLTDLLESGILKVRTSGSGPRIPLYSYTDAGEMYCMANMLAYELKSNAGEMDLESGELSEMMDNMRRHFKVGFPK